MHECRVIAPLHRIEEVAIPLIEQHRYVDEPERDPEDCEKQSPRNRTLVGAAPVRVSELPRASDEAACIEAKSVSHRVSFGMPGEARRTIPQPWLMRLLPG